MRVGFGYDSHAFDPERPCILGGVRIEGVPGLRGFSDGDAVAHAVTDALLGASALGDIGTHFPPGVDEWRDADSMILLGRAVTIVHAAGYRVGNVDVTVICQGEPRISPVADRMRNALAEVLAVPPGAVSVKGKTNEGMGWEGRNEGIAVHAVALLEGLPDA
ncbi:MAG: 2-C-methyl-D-erythritol 2,4-cyclodiphosphate synthase [Gemmatimonadales bacterium]|nr:MAG: 2-C-methyl-D-erythritol 2,4-cyclodiphosphate synthase [Gemmatimonadales bacterium]